MDEPRLVQCRDAVDRLVDEGSDVATIKCKQSQGYGQDHEVEKKMADIYSIDDSAERAHSVGDLLFLLLRELVDLGEGVQVVWRVLHYDKQCARLCIKCR
jgi:hypothetical protein